MSAAAGSRVLVVEPHFVLRRTIVLSAARLGLAHLEEASAVDIAERMVQGRTYDTVVLALDAAPPVDIERFLARCQPARVIGIVAAGQRPEAGRLQRHGLHDLLDKPARVKDLLGLISIASRA